MSQAEPKIQAHRGGPSLHLGWDELACHDARRTPYPAEWWVPRALPLAAEFEEIRRRCGNRPIRVLSAFRTIEYNRLIGGARFSQHPQGRALDLEPTTGVGLVRLWEVAHQVAVERKVIRGLGLYKNFVHVDIRPSEKLVIWYGTRPASAEVQL